MSADERDYGFVVVPAWVATSTRISPEGKLVYFLLAAHSDFDPIPETLDVTADYFGIDRAIFRKGIQSLVRHGAAQWVQGVFELRGAQIGIQE